MGLALERNMLSWYGLFCLLLPKDGLFWPSALDLDLFPFYFCVACLLLSLILECFPHASSSPKYISPCRRCFHLNNLLYIFAFCPKGLLLLSCHSLATPLLPVSHPASQLCAAASLAQCPVSAKVVPVSPCTCCMLDGSQLTLFSCK